MSQPSKFAGLFEERHQDETRARGRNEEITIAKIPGRPRGKRSNPEFKPRTVLMRDQLHLEATDILRHQKNGQDLSDLINKLLEKWIKGQKA